MASTPLRFHEAYGAVSEEYMLFELPDTVMQELKESKGE